MSLYFPVGRLRSVPALSALNDVQLSRLAESACGAVENYCNRTFTLADYDEFYPGTGTRSLFLNQYPVTRVKAVRAGMTPAIQIQNTTPNVQEALVAVLDTEVVLHLTNNGSTSETSFTWEAYPTLGAMATGINNLGSGWVATINGQFSAWGSADLSVYKTTQSVRQNTANLSVHYQYLSGYQINSASGELVMPGGWYAGNGIWSYRIVYEAGFDPVPEELIQATIELASATYAACKSDINLVSESLGSYSYTRSTDKGLKDMSVSAYQTLRYYRRPRVPYFGVP